MIWIPVSERMPDTQLSWYIVTFLSRFDERYTEAVSHVTGYEFKSARDSEATALAWMPRPDPYEGKI